MSVSDRQFLAAMNSLWFRDSRFVDSLGEPIALTLFGPGPSLELLFDLAASSVSNPGFTVRSALDALLERGSVKEVNDQCWVPVLEALQVNTSETAGVLSHLADLTSFADTVSHNVDNPLGKGRFAAIASVDEFPVGAVKQVHSSCREEGMKFLSDIDTSLYHLRDEFEGSDSETVTVGVGISFFERS